MLVLPRGHRKPGPGAQIDYSHPLAKGLLLCVPCYEGQWQQNTAGSHAPYILYGSVPRRTTTVTNPATWVSNIEGPAVLLGVDTRFFNLGFDFIPTTGVTVAIVRRKIDTTLRTGTLVGDPNFSTTFQCLCPFSDGTIYWRFGGSGGANQLTVSQAGLWTTAPDRFVFTAGVNGMAIWRNGQKLASQSTAVTRTAGSSSIAINQGFPTGDQQEINFAWFVDYPWPDSLCQWWSSEPYAALREPLVQQTAYFFGATGAAGAGSKAAHWRHRQQMGRR